MVERTSRGTAHIPAIDMVKGWAILGVTLIHSSVLDGTPWMSLLFQHAVPVFLVLFGLNSETWFRRHTRRGRIRQWYRRGLKRILVPAWAAAAVWWVTVFVLRPPEPMVRLTIGLPFWHAIGWLNQIGTSWFVTLILQFVLLFPLFHWLSRRIERAYFLHRTLPGIQDKSCISRTRANIMLKRLVRLTDSATSILR